MSYELPVDYAERVYAGWLGKCIGVRLGAPVENWTYAEIAQNLGEVRDFLPLPAGKIFKPDDDTAVPLVMIRALEDHGAGVTAQHMGEAMLDYLGDMRGTIWWGGYGHASENTAYVNLANGIPAPVSGSMALNGKMLAEQIGGQIFSDIWGLVAPNQPARAAQLAALASSVANDGDGIQGGRFVAGMVSLAFSESDPRTLIIRALELVDPHSEYARVVHAVLDFHAASPADWHACFAFLHDNFGYDRYPGAVHIIPNTGVVVMALLYCDGDFSRAVQIATMAGWDTDCNAGNVGAIMGVAVGLAGIDMHWRTQMNDTLVAASVIGSRNLTDIPACADLFCRLGAELAGKAPTRKARIHFDYPDSTHGMLTRTRGAEITALRQQEGALNVIMRRLTKKGEAEVFVKTYLHPKELSANYYGASFSPNVHPGQRVTARVYAPADVGDLLLAALFVWDDNSQQRHQAQAVSLTPGAWSELSFEIPALHNALLSEVGIVLHNLGEAWTGTLRLDDLDWGGAPTYSSDFARERREFDAISQWTFLRGYWRLEPDGYHGSGALPYESYTGDIAWTDLTLNATIMPLVGREHRINVRVQGARRSYAAALAGDNRLVLYKNAGGYRELASAPFAWQAGETYNLTVRAQGDTLTASVEGGPEIVWQDGDAPYLDGQIGLSGAGGAHTCCKRIAVEGI